jgi:hypothetical protein
MGQLDSTCTDKPHHGYAREAVAVPVVALSIAAQVDPFESKGLKPGYHVIQAQGLCLGVGRVSEGQTGTIALLAWTQAAVLIVLLTKPGAFKLSGSTAFNL